MSSIKYHQICTLSALLSLLQFAQFSLLTETVAVFATYVLGYIGSFKMKIFLAGQGVSEVSKVVRRPGPWSRGYKTFFILSSTEHEILNAHKYQNSHNQWKI